MRPLPRLHAVTDAGVLARDDFGILAAAIAAGGASVALHARDRTASAVRLTGSLTLFVPYEGIRGTCLPRDKTKHRQAQRNSKQ